PSAARSRPRRRIFTSGWNNARVRILVSVLAVVAASPFFSSIEPLSPTVRTQVADSWHAGCPVPLSGLRVLTVSYWGFDEHVHRGQLVVNAQSAPKLAAVFRQ